MLVRVQNCFEKENFVNQLVCNGPVVAMRHPVGLSGRVRHRRYIERVDSARTPSRRLFARQVCSKG